MMANTLQKALDAAFKERDKLRDTYVSVEHLVLGLVTQDNRFLKPTLVKQVRASAGNYPTPHLASSNPIYIYYVPTPLLNSTLCCRA